MEWMTEEQHKSLKEGIKDVEEGRLNDLGSFAEYALDDSKPYTDDEFKMMMEDKRIEYSSGSIWKDLGFENWREMERLSFIRLHMEKFIERRNLIYYKDVEELIDDLGLK